MEQPMHMRLQSEEQPLEKPRNPQSQCGLFKIPLEIRESIFRLALADYEDPSADQQYDKDSCWARPSYNSPRRSDIALLQTCQAVFRETWFLPFMLKEQTHWITDPDRAPPHYNFESAARRLELTVGDMRRRHGQPVEIGSLRIFTQMYKIEERQVAMFLETVPDLAFRRLYITIRHTDFWFWERDAPLGFDSRWVPIVSSALPSSVEEVIIEMETVERKQKQLYDIARQMTERWYFQKRDGTPLVADSTPNSYEVTRWQGSSTWHNERWVRDESSEGVIEYYVAAVKFQSQLALEKRGGMVSSRVLRAITWGGPGVADALIYPEEISDEMLMMQSEHSYSTQHEW
ncbi:hypothetical protein NQ176_g4219 [Zarea fungicola]|uniref:Uncharacterized protein n=1 Tax=Zarea fungicola TaxID=93591 RepID=A0ACC1NEL5_9HYPO|nr:hypothetical protein NQ176_g4219 [Lecanicillium fungicola]